MGENSRTDVGIYCMYATPMVLSLVDCGRPVEYDMKRVW